MNFLSDDECKLIVLRACGVRPQTEDDLVKVLGHANQIRFSALSLDLVLEGKAAYYVDGGEVILGKAKP